MLLANCSLNFAAVVGCCLASFLLCLDGDFGVVILSFLVGEGGGVVLLDSLSRGEVGFDDGVEDLLCGDVGVDACFCFVRVLLGVFIVEDCLMLR